jgi:hypothetical protein
MSVWMCTNGHLSNSMHICPKCGERTARVEVRIPKDPKTGIYQAPANREINPNANNNINIQTK